MSSGAWVDRCIATTLGGGRDGLHDPPHARDLQRSPFSERAKHSDTQLLAESRSPKRPAVYPSLLPPPSSRRPRPGPSSNQHSQPQPATPFDPAPPAHRLLLLLSPCMFPKPWICQGDSERAGTDRSPLGRERPRESRAVPALTLAQSPNRYRGREDEPASARQGVWPALSEGTQWRPTRT